MSATIDWNSIGAKMSEAVAKKVSKLVDQDTAFMAKELVADMELAIACSSELTYNESEKVSLASFSHSGTTKILTRKTDGSVIGEYRLSFDFAGDKSLVSLSPRKAVHNLVALFNNGYASNNVDPNHPIRGIWHGREIAIGPRSRGGAHFIGEALQNFKSDCSSMFSKYNISAKVNPEYDGVNNF